MAKQHKTRSERKAARARKKAFQRATYVGIILLFASFILWIIFSAIMNDQRDSSIIKNSNLPTPFLVGTKQYASAPPLLIDVTKEYKAVVSMAKGGIFIIQLYPDKSPNTVNNFVFLAREGYYDGVSFHRVLDGFMAQTGDPTGTGGGGPGYTFGNEINDLAFDKAGVVAMANTGLPNSNGSQFFITFGPVNLSGKDYTIFGQVIEGMEVVNAITRRDPTMAPSYVGDIIDMITIVED